MKKSNKYICYLYLLLPILFFPFINFSRENDIWFLLSHGRYVLSHGFPYTDILSMHTNMKFVMQQWLSSVLFYTPYKFLGEIGLYFLVFIVNILIIYFLYKLCLKLSNNNIYLSCLYAGVIDTLLEFNFIVPRPAIFSILIFIILFYIMECFIKKRSKIIYFLILLSLLEVNLHASMWPVLFILLLPYLVYFSYLYLKNKDKSILKLLIVIVLMIVVGFINPYGINSMIYSINSYGVSILNKTIVEMHGFLIQTTNDIVKQNSYFTLVVFFITNLLFILNKKTLDIYKILLFFGTFYMALLNIRNNSLFIICSLPFTIDIFKKFKFKYYKKFNISILFVYLVFICIFIYGTCNYKLYKLNNSDKNIINYMEKYVSKKEAIYTDFDYGSYYEFYGYKAYIDGRAEVFLKSNNKEFDYYTEWTNMYYGKSSIKKFLNKYKFNYLVVSKNSLLYKYLKNNDNYKLVVHGENYLFERINV